MALFGLSNPLKGDANMSGSDKLMVLGAMLKDFGNAGQTDNVGEINKLMIARRQKAQQDAAMSKLLGALSGGEIEPPAAIPEPQSAGDYAPKLAPAGITSIPQLPQRTAPRQLGDPGVNSALMAAWQAGVPRLNDLVGIMDKGRSKVEVANGVAYDPYSTAPGTFFAQYDKGQGPDGQGGVRNLPGAVASSAEMAGAVSGAQEQAKAGWDLAPVSVGGQTMLLPRAIAAPMLAKAFADRAGGGLPQNFGITRSSEDTIRAEGAARNEVERAAAQQARVDSAPRQLAALDEMERLLPDVVSGFGADLQLNAQRALAAAGNKDAQRKVAATETFVNQGRVLVADIIKSFGSNPTEGERKFAEKMSGADATLNPETLREGIRLHRERIARDTAAARGGQGTRKPAANYSPAAIEAEIQRRRAAGLM